MTTFSEYIERAHMEAMYVLRISGLPYLFANAPLPARWGGPTVHIHEGEDYTWQATLQLGDSFGSVGTRIEPKGGVGQSGGMDFDLLALGYQSGGQQDDPLLSLLLSGIGRRDSGRAASLSADFIASISGAGTSVRMVANPWFGGTAPQFLYLGTETIRLASVTANTQTLITSTVTRARFGSQAQTHVGVIRDGAAVAGGAMYVANYPLTIVGRIAEVWCCPGEYRRDGQGRVTFWPHGQNLADPANRIIYAGVVDGHSEDGAVVTIRTSSLDQLLKGSAVAQTPTVLMRTGSEWQDAVYIGAHNWWLHLDLEVDGAVNYPIIHISDNSALTAGDTITIGSANFVAGTHWAIGANIGASYINIANAINAGAGFPTLYSALPLGVGVEVRSGLGLSSPLSFTTTNPGAITATASTLRPQAAQQLLNRRLRRSQNADGLAPYEDVPEGLYRHAQVGGYISDTLAEILPPPISIKCGMGYVADATPEGGRVVLRATVYPLRYGSGARLVWITRVGAVESFLRDCGFTELEYEATEGAGGANVWQIVATKAPAALRIPLNPLPPPPRLYIQSRDAWTATFLTSNGWTDDDGNLIPRFVFIKDVGILQMSSFGISATEGTYLTGIARAPTALGSQNAEEVYIEASDTEPPVIEVQRIVALPNVSANRMMLYLLLGGSGYATNDPVWDKGWPGAGLHIPSRLVASADWLARELERPEPRDGWVWITSDDARKLLDEELKATQQQIVSDLGQLRLVAMEVPLEAAPAARRVVGPGQTVTDDSKGVGFDRQPNRIVNVVKLKGGWDARTNKWDLDQINRQQDSIGTWGEQQAVSVELRGISAVGDASAKGRAIAQRIFGLYARPYALVEVDVAPRAAWLWGIGDEVTLTHPWVPNPHLPRRGCRDMLCRIVNKEARYAGGQAKSFVTLTLQSYALAGQRYSLWGPSAQLLYSGTANTWTVVETTYGDTVRGLADSDYFALGYGVKTQRLGDSSAAPVSRSIATRTGSVGSVNLTFTAALAGSAGQRYVMWYDDYDSVKLSDAQRAFVFMSNFGGALALPSGTDPAFQYR